MIALVFVAVVLVIVAMALRDRSHGGVAPDTTVAGARTLGLTLAAALDRAVEAEIITAEQAAAVIDAERERQRTPSARAPARVPPVLEALGYLGGVLVMAGVITLMSQFWDDLRTWSRLTILGTVTAALTLAGVLIRDETEPVLWRLRGFLLLLGTGTLAGFAGISLVDGLDVRGEPTVFAVGALACVHAGLLWWRRDRPAQHASCFGGLLAAVVGALAWAGTALDWSGGPGPAGIVLWLIGALWLAASVRQLLPPALIGVLLGAATTLVAGAPMSASWHHAGVLFGLATAAALVAVGIHRDEFLLTGIGVVGAFVYLPVCIGVFFGGTIGVPAVMLVSGLALLALTVRLFRRRRGQPIPLAGTTSGGR